MIDRLRKDGVKVQTAYRLEHRTVVGQIAVDSGYMRTRFEGPAGAPKPMDQYTRFLVTLRIEKDGAWRILADASLPSTQKVWDAAQAVDGLKFDS